MSTNKDKEQAKVDAEIIDGFLQQHRPESREALGALGRIVRYNGEIRRELSMRKNGLDALDGSLDRSRQRNVELEQALSAAQGELRRLQSVNEQLRRDLQALQPKAQEAQEEAQEDNWKLIPGTEQRSPTAKEFKRREAHLRSLIEGLLPEFVKAVRHQEIDVLTMHQDAWAAAYHKDEFTLCGMAIKYAGLYGRNVMIIGKAGETCKPPVDDTPRGILSRLRWRRKGNGS